MRKDSLLGEIGLRFIKQTENLASESLNYILGKSPNTLKGFNELVKVFDDRLTEVRYSNTPLWLEIFGKGKDQWNDVNALLFETNMLKWSNTQLQCVTKNILSSCLGIHSDHEE